MSSNDSIVQTSRLSILWRLVVIMGSLILSFGIIAHFLEPQTFHTFFDGVWWAIVTTFTIGYGDFVPQTYAGRTVAIILILLGTAFGSYYMVSFATEMLSRQYLRQKGKSTVSFQNHIIIVGWNERVKQLLQQFETLYPKTHLVLIDETLPILPKKFAHLFFVKGCPYHDDTLKRANIIGARTIVITADQEKDESSADTLSVLTILAAKGLNPSLYCIVEILTAQQVDNANRAGANEVLQTNKLIGHILTSSLLFPSVSQTFISFCNHSSEAGIRLIPHNSEAEETFRSCSIRSLEKDILLLGVKRDGKDYINPLHPFPLYPDDLLIVLMR
ncbi:potassium channel family protein [Bacillus sp. OTU530]|uniref:potassium channel family protein n=1 Tax=Bacillus sp. OTU530 TaxID=3043862 RepID=UPI00313B35E9